MDIAPVSARRRRARAPPVGEMMPATIALLSKNSSTSGIFLLVVLLSLLLEGFQDRSSRETPSSRSRSAALSPSLASSDDPGVNMKAPSPSSTNVKISPSARPYLRLNSTGK